ncbi:FecCD family ABC transporter permease [Fangia hongkongensis]|uniref:FecCD family ABC transporter permease n=1 Tax=Fangia hongkongensis TaxID=270495 RepID=UPI000376FEF5|nr:iron ABC transporter permease [Fangia hongkongensis]MBK2125836.1 iron ABC transporter permease [Fangia hongkongensis]
MKSSAAYTLYLLQKRRYFITMMILSFLIVVIGVCSLKYGAMSISWGKLFSNDALAGQVVFELRLPRMLASLLVGGALALSGVLMQGLFRNPLADPALLGMTSGASLFAMLFLLSSSFFVTTSSFLSEWGLAISAFIGSLVVTYLTYLLSLTKGKSNIALLVLSGVAINALCGAVMGFLTYLSSDDTLRSITFWSMGSLANIDWLDVYLLLPFILMALFLVKRSAKYLNAMICGEEYAKTLGLNVQKEKTKAILAIALLVGISTAVAGPISFVGLVVPHIMRFLIGHDQKYLMLLSTIFGALLVGFSDVLSRVILSPAEIPIGLITAIIGAPYFMYLLLNMKYKGI